MKRPGTEQHRQAPGHFQARVREACCEAFFTAFFDLTDKKPRIEPLENLRGNSEGHRALLLAWKRFTRAHMHEGTLFWQQRGMTKKDFCKILHRYWKTWNETRECNSKSRKKEPTLTWPEWEQLHKAVTTPLQVDGKTVRFASLKEVQQKLPWVKDLCDKSGLGYQPLVDGLRDRFPSIHYGPEDRAARLCPKTFTARQHLADVWAARAPWLLLPQEEPVNDIRRSERLKIQDPEDEHEGDDDDDAVDPVRVYWNPKWMEQFGFMLDATSFTNAEGPLTRKPRHVYYDVNDVYGPTEEPPNPSISQTISIMVYTVIHKHLGVVVGPDIMYTGTRLKKSTKHKEKQFADEGVKTWCVTRLLTV